MLYNTQGLNRLCAGSYFSPENIDNRIGRCSHRAHSHAKRLSMPYVLSVLDWVYEKRRCTIAEYYQKTTMKHPVFSAVD